MNHFHLPLSILAISVMCSGCTTTNQPPAPKTTTEKIDQVSRDTSQASQELKDYSYAQRVEFVTQMQSRLDEINREIDEIAAKVEKSNDAIKAESKPKIQTLRDQADKLKKQLSVAKDATENTWEDVKAGFRKGYADFKEGITAARQWASDKIAP
ncbi:hypothetical protein LBMAG53_34520 [Planctomycetota bacterium]|nr:hypothetical protein LBMAG53_34520 [Planctomycetota bacterium]